MLCQNCKKKEATVHRVENINGKPCEIHLCGMCACEMFAEFENEVQSAVFAGLFGDDTFGESVCPACGMPFSEYERTGLLGCPSCYDVFKDRLLPYITRIQGKTVHVGKGGGVNTSEHELRLKLTSLQQEMENALSRGDYAAAGRINGQMNALKKRGTGDRR